MRVRLPLRASVLGGLLVLLAPARAIAATPGVDWPQFRGIQASGIAEGHPLPTTWNVETGENIAWKAPISGLAHASPIVWGQRVFVITAVPADGKIALKVGLYGEGDSADDMVAHDFKLLCLDAQTGKLLWEQTAHSGVPRFQRHTKATHLNSTPATDGQHVVALMGSQGLFCYTVDGQLKWKKDLGPLDVGPHDGLQLHWGFASSPIIADGRVIVQADLKVNSFLAAFDVNDGRELWRVVRDDVPAWATPTALPTSAGTQILVNGCKHMGAYTLDGGKVVWKMSGGGGLPVPAPVVADGLIYLTSNHRPIRDGDPLKPIFAVRADATGELPVPTRESPGPQVAWMTSGRGNYMQTPLVYQGLAYFCNDNGSTTVYDARTGEQRWRERLGTGRTGFTASGVAGDGKVYFTSEEGDVFVLKAGPAHDVLAHNEMKEVCMATPAISNGAIFFRTQSQLVCVRAAR